MVYPTELGRLSAVLFLAAVCLIFIFLCNAGILRA